MDKLIKALTATAEIYGRKLTDNQIDGYLAVLSGYPEDKVIEALASIIKTSEWFPKPVEILTAMSKAHDPTPLLELPPLSEPDQAFGLEMFALMGKLMAQKIDREVYEKTMLELADKHGVGDRVRNAIANAEIEQP